MSEAAVIEAGDATAAAEELEKSEEMASGVANREEIAKACADSLRTDSANAKDAALNARKDACKKSNMSGGAENNAVGEIAKSLKLNPEEVRAGQDEIAEKNIGCDSQGNPLNARLTVESVADVVKSIEDSSFSHPEYSKFLNTVSSMFRQVADLPEIPSGLKDILKKDPISWDTSDIQEINEGMNKYISENEGKINKLEQKSREKEIESGQSAGSKGKWTAIVKFIVLLEVAGTIAAALFLMTGYANAHSGCMQVSSSAPHQPEVHTKVFCSGDDTTFNVQQCGCPDPNYNVKITCDAANNAPTPPNLLNSTNPPCKNLPWEPGTTGSYNYYSFSVMSPAGAALDIAKKTTDILADAASTIERIMMIGGIVVGSIIGLLMLFKVISLFKKNNKK